MMANSSQQFVSLLILSVATWASGEKLDAVVTRDVKVCQPSGPGMLGDLLRDAGCHLDRKSGPHHSISIANSSALEAVRKFSHQVMEQTMKVNGQSSRARSVDDSDFECGVSCVKPPACCDVETKLSFPLWGLSLSSESMVEIVQDPEGIQQPIFYQQCRTSETNIVRGRCLQTSLPRLLFVRSSQAGRKSFHYRDVVLMPSNCECIISLNSTETTSDEAVKRTNATHLDVDSPASAHLPSRIPPQYFLEVELNATVNPTTTLSSAPSSTSTMSMTSRPSITEQVTIAVGPHSPFPRPNILVAESQSSSVTEFSPTTFSSLNATMTFKLKTNSSVVTQQPITTSPTTRSRKVYFNSLEAFDSG